MIIVPTPIIPLPVPGPLRTQPQVEFDANMAGWVGAQPQMITEVGAANTAAYTNALDAANSASIAAAAVAAAVAATGVLPWVSGTTYTAGSPGVGASVVSSLANFKTYRRKTNGAGTTDPSADPTNWQLISWGAYPLLHVREQQPAGTASSSPVLSGNNDVTLNTTIANTISGASLSGNNVILPAGTYDVDISSGRYNTQSHKLSLYNVTAGATQLVGTNEYNTPSTGASTRSNVTGRFKITATTTFKLIHWIQISGGVGPSAAGAGISEIYATAAFYQVEQG